MTSATHRLPLLAAAVSMVLSAGSFVALIASLGFTRSAVPPVAGLALGVVGFALAISTRRRGAAAVNACAVVLAIVMIGLNAPVHYPFG